MGKLHNIAVFIRNSTIHNDAWDDIAGKALGIDNITRWNSWFKLLDAAISQEGPLSVFVNQYHRELEDDILTHDDWQVLKMTHEFLQPFHQATMEQQMAWASIDQVLENMDILFVQFEDAKVSRRLCKYCLRAEEEKLNFDAGQVCRKRPHGKLGSHGLVGSFKVLRRNRQNPVYATALCSIQKNGGGISTVIGHQSGGRQPLLQRSGNGRSIRTDRFRRREPCDPVVKREVASYERIRQSMSVLDEPGDEDEFEKFINAPPRHMLTANPLEWWCREEQRAEYPRLHQMALDILSVPAMSDEPERCSLHKADTFLGSSSTFRGQD
ncbi:transposase-like protein [Hirsutella rhossiliensis]|uniref:Transposase-like protein n=1 Tax=Hirsutella rhossiliensis TaxID=111463 RepID=A0A9P8MVW4_9HYPO|nr:transposase-like protein [Hirsutella rhossiliensis]KAH0962002.1 transposase-like protein [Hirsutella rhossiliensis]